MTVKRKTGNAARKRGPGDGYAFSQSVGNGIIRRVRVGNYLRTACSAEGVPMRTFYDWLRAGARDLKAGQDTVLGRFSRALDRAEAEAEANLAERMHTIALQGVDLSTALRATESILKKRFRKHWGDTITKLPPEELRDATDEQLAHMVRDTFGAEPLLPGEVADGDQGGDDD